MFNNRQIYKSHLHNISPVKYDGPNWIHQILSMFSTNDLLIIWIFQIIMCVCTNEENINIWSNSYKSTSFYTITTTYWRL